MRFFLLAMCAFVACAALGQARIEDPQDDFSGEYAQALATWYDESPTALQGDQTLPLAFFTWKVKSLAPFVRKDKYFASHLNVCGIMLELWDEPLGALVRAEASEVVEDATNQDTLTDEEQKAIADKTASQFNLLISEDPKVRWRYNLGAHTGALASYITMWHLTPDNPTLTEWITASLEGCAKDATEAPTGSDAGMVAALKALGAVKSSKYGAAEIGAVSKALGDFLKSSVPVKYRWKEADGRNP